LLVPVVALGVLSLLAALHSLGVAARHWRRARRVVPRGSAGPDFTPGVTVLVPCCGSEEGLEANLDALLRQDYPRAQVRFVVESEGDDAVPVIERVRARHPGRSERVVAGLARGQGQKVHNLLAALDHAPSSEVLVFADSDGRPHPGWLARLVAELSRPGVGVASSYRFYRPRPPGFATLLRSVWNLSVLALLGNHERNFAWGGSMAIRRAHFESAGVRAAWRGALSDDYALTHAIRRAGLRVAFVPECLIGSEGGVGLWAFLAWSARQISITRVYWPALFRLAVLGNLPSTAFLALAPATGGAGALTLLGLLLLLGAASGGLRALALAGTAPRWRDELRQSLWAYVLLAPLGGLVTTWGILRALASRRIEWRGKTYLMRSPHETVVLPGEPSV
jgi:cellulose synthase/poly-beta-1,6-N-acetylglucosamine synthase-like glycosyltransferase